MTQDLTENDSEEVSDTGSLEIEDPGDADLAFTCPRCSTEVTARYYGPCDNCRQQLLESQHRVGGEVETPEYVPKMNVTPNAVALKDD